MRNQCFATFPCSHADQCTVSVDKPLRLLIVTEQVTMQFSLPYYTAYYVLSGLLGLSFTLRINMCVLGDTLFSLFCLVGRWE